MRAIDMSQPLRCGKEISCGVPEQLPVYEGYACEEYRFAFASHLGCYFETAGHLLRGGTMTSDVPVSRLLLPAAIARLDADRGGAIEAEEIAAALAEPLRQGEALLVDARGREDRYFSRASAEWMVAQQVALVGASMRRYDTGFEHPTGVFVPWFEADIPIIANLCRIEEITADRVFLLVLPMAIERVCTAPCRVVVLEGEPAEVEWLAQHLRA
jgi:kynurenine formamidase